jgi:toxin-antitoxin system PIN domain toxin
MRALLDVNFLLALNDTEHRFHQTAKAWLVTHMDDGWASCPLTQNGCVRILSQTGYSSPVSIQTAIHTALASCLDQTHSFWPDDISLLDTTLFDHGKIHGPRQLTDLYLLALAVKHGGRLVTFDREIPLNAVRGTKRAHLVVV